MSRAKRVVVPQRCPVSWPARRDLGIVVRFSARPADVPLLCARLAVAGAHVHADVRAVRAWAGTAEVADAVNALVKAYLFGGAA